jgi:hypothetical protein
MRAWSGLAAAVVMLGDAHAGGEMAKAELSRRMMSAFECSVYAGMANLKDEEKRLFELGLADGREFLRAVRTGAISQETLKTAVPLLGVQMLMSGPSEDFMLGRMYEGVAESAFNKIYETPLDAIGRDAPSERDRSVAKVKFVNANCAFIR